MSDGPNPFKEVVVGIIGILLSIIVTLFPTIIIYTLFTFFPDWAP